MKKIRNYKCPNCNHKLTKVSEWQTCSVRYNYDLETEEWQQLDIEGGDHEAWSCPYCGKDLPETIANQIERTHHL